MATKISSKTTGVGGLEVTGDASGVLELASANGTTALTIDASQNVGIGTSSPSQKLQIAGSQLLSNPGSSVYTYFDGVSAAYVGREAVAGAMVFGVNSAERMRIDSSGNLLFNSGYGSVATAYGCRAWVNFNGTGTVAIRGSGNVSSITDNGTGDYTVNFTTAIVDANYTPVYGMQTFATGGHQGYDNGSCSNYNGTQTTSALRVSNYQGNANSGVDMFMVSVSIFR